jgi:pimeloyl-ACP methyl ester carboxylesterase
MMRRSLFAGLVALGCFVAPAEARTFGSLAFEPCALTDARGTDDVEAQCTTFRVPENRRAPDGRSIALAIAWVPSRAEAEAAEDPVFMLAGGPGQGARQTYPRIAPAFREILRTRHVILVDQRGTGASNPLKCVDKQGRSAIVEEDEPLEPGALRRFAERCRAALDADPRHYTTSDAIQDLDAVRAALGASTIDLVGISYGTRVAQAYLRRYPQHTRAVVLDGVVPPSLILGADHAKNLEASLDLQFARCAADAACRTRFGDPRAKLDALLAEVRSTPREVRFRDPATGAEETATLDAVQVAGVARLFAYSPLTAALLPLTLAETAAGRPDVLMAQARLATADLGEEIMHGMQLSVMCTEDVPFLKPDPADEGTVLGNTLIELGAAQCAVWPKGELPADFHAPLVSDKPVLVLSGEFDPVTPPRYGDAVLEGYANGRHLVARGTGHNVLPVGCAPKLVAEFLAGANARALDAGCLDELRYTKPFTGFYGWEP